MSIRTEIKGLQELQAANARVLAALKPSGAFGRCIQYVTLGAQRVAAAVSHVDTGAMRAAHIARLALNIGRGYIYLNPAARNPRSGRAVAEYAVYEHNRGDSHAFYDITVDDYGPTLVRRGYQIVGDATGL